MKLAKRIVLLLAVFCLLPVLIFTVKAEAASSVTPETVTEEILSYYTGSEEAASVQELLDGAWAEEAGGTCDWVVMTLSRLYPGEYDYTAYLKSFLQAEADDEGSPSHAAKCRNALLTIACGARTEKVTEALDEAPSDSDVMGLIYTLQLFNSGLESETVTEDSVIDTLLSKQKEDGGFALGSGDSDVDVTAMSLYALAPSVSDREDVKEAAEKAVEFLAGQQLDSGNFASYGTENPESGCQVLVAISALGIDPLEDERFIKNGNTILDGIMKYRLEDGSYCHAEGSAGNDLATAEVFYSAAAVQLLRADRGPLFVFDTSDLTEISLPEKSASTETESKTTGGIGTAGISYKIYCYAGIGAATLIACLILLIRKKHYKSLFSVLILALIGVLFVHFTDFASVSSYYDASALDKENPVGTVTLTIRCDLIKTETDNEYIPEDGFILEKTEIPIEEGETVYDVLTDAAKAYGLQCENEGGVGNAHGETYIASINYIYERQYGELSGWIYLVNDEKPSVNCGSFKVSDGDDIVWVYTKDLGNDLDYLD